MQFKNFRGLATASIALPLCLLLASVCSAQNAPADTAFVQNAVANALDDYKQAVGVQSHLYNGTEYIDYKKAHLEGDQFFVSKAVERGDIYYDGSWHTQVPMLYDLVTDEVIIPHNSTGLLLKLITSKIDTFVVHGHVFVNLQNDSAAQAAELQPGFYDLMYNGDKAQFLVRRTKNIQDRATAAGMEGEFRVSDKLYIRKDGAYHQVSSKGSVYKVLKDQKKQLQKYVSSQKLKFRKAKEKAVLATVRYYDSLTAGPDSAN